MNGRVERPAAEGPLVFRPARSLGWLSLLVLAILVLIPGVAGALATLRRPELALTTGIVAIAVAGPLLVLVVLFPAMRYVLEGDTLTISYGPVLRYRLRLAEIESIQRRDLRISVWSSLRVPGLALFTVPYNDVGLVKMCATRAAERIILIRTPRALYGITPADEDAFMTAVHARLG